MNEIFKVIEEDENNCINCISFKVIAKDVDYARCTNKECIKHHHHRANRVKVSSTATRVLSSKEKDVTYSRMNCKYYT